jgi:hypothetical protein
VRCQQVPQAAATAGSSNRQQHSRLLVEGALHRPMLDPAVCPAMLLLTGVPRAGHRPAAACTHTSASSWTVSACCRLLTVTGMRLALPKSIMTTW